MSEDLGNLELEDVSPGFYNLAHGDKSYDLSHSQSRMQAPYDMLKSMTDNEVARQAGRTSPHAEHAVGALGTSPKKPKSKKKPGKSKKGGKRKSRRKSRRRTRRKRKRGGEMDTEQDPNSLLGKLADKIQGEYGRTHDCFFENNEKRKTNVMGMKINSCGMLHKSKRSMIYWSSWKSNKEAFEEQINKRMSLPKDNEQHITNEQKKQIYEIMKPFLADPEKQRVAEDITYKEDVIEILKKDNNYKAVGPIIEKILTKKTGGKRTRRRKKKFKKHYMWNTRGKRYVAKTYKQHIRGVKLGHTHKKPKKKSRRRRR